MRIGIDARFYGPRVGGGGIGRYVEELVTHLQLIDTKNTYVLFLKKENFHECVIRNPLFSKQLLDVHWYGLREQREVPRAVRDARLDFVHYPHWNVPLFSRVPFIVTIHDLILLEDRHSARVSSKSPILHGFKYAGFRTVLERAVHKSRHILTVSAYSKESIVRHFRVPRNKITTIPNGVITRVSDRDISLSKLGVYDPYFLYVGNAYPHKNLEMMMHAFARFSEQNDHVQLVIAGRRDVFSRQLEAEARDIGLRKGAVRFLDLPSDDEISTLYQHAKLFVFPSRIEGFGIPPLEAMAHGTLVAAARAASLPEVLRECALYFDPHDVEGLAEIMQRSLSSSRLFAKKIEDGKRLSASYRWSDAARKTLDVYQRFPILKR